MNNKYLQSNDLQYTIKEYDVPKLNFKKNDVCLKMMTHKKVILNLIQLSEKLKSKYILLNNLMNENKAKEIFVLEKNKTVNKKNNGNVKEYFTKQMQSLKQKNVNKLYESVNLAIKLPKTHSNLMTIDD